MKLQPASRKEVIRIATGCGILCVILIAAFFVLSLVGVGTFSYRVILSAVGGSLVAVFNFALMCLMVQNAAGTEDKKLLKAKVQASYNFRLFLQAIWVLVCFIAPIFTVLAGAIPLVFPTATIFFLQFTGRLVPPSPENRPAVLEEEEKDDPGPFEV